MKIKMIWLSAALVVLLLADGVNASYIGSIDGNHKNKPEDIANIIKLVDGFEINGIPIDLLGGNLTFLTTKLMCLKTRW